jgi:phenylalanyl-tRNA synthetase beta chain
MPTINISKNYLFRLLGKKISESVLLERISMMGTALEGESKDEISIELFPNRPDMLSVEGFARGLSCFLGLRKSLPEYSAKKSSLKIEVDKSVKNIRPFIKCGLVKNVRLTDEAIKSLMQVQEKLHQTHGRKRKRVAIGVHDFDRIKFPLLYKAVAPDSYSFVPLGDKKNFTLEQILKKTPKGQAYAWTLSDAKEYPLLVDAEDNVLSFPPIINGELTAVHEGTKNLFIDVTGTDERAVSQALVMLVTSIADMGGEIYSVASGKDITPNLEHSEMHVDISYVNRLLGLSLKESELKKLLLKMGLGYKNKKAVIPPYRVDIIHPIDIVEDIAIAYGYENFEPVLPTISTTGEESAKEIFYRHISEIMVGLGFLETSTFHLTNYSDIKTKMNCDISYIELANSVSSEFYILRPWLLPSQMKVLADNKTKEFPHRIFEIGTVFTPDSGEETKVLEKKFLSVAIADKASDFTKIKQVLDVIMSALRVKYSVEEYEHSSFIPGRAASIIVNSRKAGFLGEISPLVLSGWQLETPVVAMELDIDLIRAILQK